MDQLPQEGARKEDSDDDGDGEEGGIGYFESSLESLFGQHQAASGTPGQRYTLFLDEKGTTKIHYRIPESRTNRLFAHYQWDAGVFLCRLIYRHVTSSPPLAAAEGEEKGGRLLHLCKEESDVRQADVIELGAGTGLPGIISAASGASSVLITDYPDKGILQALQENVQTANVTSIARVEGLDWTDEGALGRTCEMNPKGFSRILCADVLWLSAVHNALLHTIHALLRPSSDARCILVSGFHTGRRALSNFFHLAMQTIVDVPHGDGLQKRCLRPSRRSDGQPAVFEYNVVDRSARNWSASRPFPFTCEHEDEFDNMDDYTERSKWLLYVCLEWSNDASS